MEARNGAKEYLLKSNGICVQEEWLDACVQWITEEEGASLPEQRLYSMVYEQWLRADLRDVAVQPCISETVIAQDKGIMSGKFILQVNSVVDVGSAAYGQLQKLKGQSLDMPEKPEKKNFNSKPTRFLLLNLTDGTVEVQAMEYMPVQQLSAELTPGTKILLQGEIVHHLGVLLLSSDCVHVLGGGVDQLASENTPQRVLGRLLNIEEPVVTPERPNPRLEPISNPHQGTRHQTSSVSHRVSHNTQLDGDIPGSTDTGVDTLSHPKEVSIEEIQPVEEFEFSEGMDDFDDLDVNEEDVIQAALLDESEIIDDPGHDQWPDEFEQFEDEIMDYQDNFDEEEEERHMFPKSKGPIEIEQMSSQLKCQTTSLTNSHPTDSSTIDHSKSKLSLKHKPARTRVIETDTRTNPPVASVRPVQSEESSQKQSIPCSCDSEHPVCLESLLEVENHCWSLRPFVKVKARFVKVCHRICHNEGEWLATVLLSDDTGTHLTVDLSNKMLELMIGFTAKEFNNCIKPNREDPILKSKAGKGFARCQSAICQLNGYMIMTQRSDSEHPCVVKLLDA